MTPKTRLLMAAALIAVVGITAATPAYAQRGRGRGRQAGPPVVIVGGPYGPYDPWWWGPYPGYPYPPYPGTVYVNAGASLRLQVTPRDAEVYLDGYLVGTVDDFDGFFQRLQLRPGPHTLEFYRDGFRNVRQQIYISRGTTFRVQYALRALSPGDQPDARPVAEPLPLPPPPDARQAGQDRGRTPAPPRETDFGSLAIRVQPADADVFIDGERWATSGPGDRLVVQVPAGRRHVEVRKTGLRTFSQDVTVRAGETLSLNISLRTEEPR